MNVLWNIELDREANELSRKRDEKRLPVLISIIIIKLFHSILYKMQTYDQILTFSLPFRKVIQIVPIDQGIIMVIHNNFMYTVIRLNKPECEIFCNGKLPILSHNIKKYDRNKIIYQSGNRLQILNWSDKQLTFSTNMANSQIYNNKFDYFLSSQYIAFWKQSYFKFQINYTYQIQIYKRATLNCVKKYKFESVNPQKIVVVNFNQILEIVTFETMGYTINVHLVQSKVVHEIKSIYKLLHVSTQVHNASNNSSLRNPSVCLGFTHNQLIPQTRLCYQITADYISKYYQQIHAANHICISQNYTIVTPTLTDHYSSPNIQIEVRIRYGRKIKYLLMIQTVMAGKQNTLSDGDKGKTEEQMENTDNQNVQNKQQLEISHELLRQMLAMLEN